MKLKSAESISQYNARLMKLVLDLGTVGYKVSGATKEYAFLRGLSPDYQDLRQTIMALDDKAFADVYKLVTNRETELLLRETRRARRHPMVGLHPLSWWTLTTLVLAWLGKAEGQGQAMCVTSATSQVTGSTTVRSGIRSTKSDAPSAGRPDTARPPSSCALATEESGNRPAAAGYSTLVPRGTW